MKTLTVTAKENSYEKILHYLEQMDDVAYFEEDEEEYSKEHRKAYKEAVKELENGESIDIDDYMKQRGINV